MTVQDLIDMLTDLPPDAEVRIAHQPNWPFEYSVGDAMTTNFEVGDDAPEEATVVWLTAHDQLGYLPGEVADHLKNSGWR